MCFNVTKEHFFSLFEIIVAYCYFFTIYRQIYCEYTQLTAKLQMHLLNSSKSASICSI